MGRALCTQIPQRACSELGVEVGVEPPVRREESWGWREVGRYGDEGHRASRRRA